MDAIDEHLSLFHRPVADSVPQQPSLLPSPHQHHHHQQQESPPHDDDLDQNLDPAPDDEHLKQMLVDELQDIALAEAVAKVRVFNPSWEDGDEDAELKNSLADELYHLAIKQAVNERIIESKCDTKFQPFSHPDSSQENETSINEFGASEEARVSRDEFDGWNCGIVEEERSDSGEVEREYAGVYYVGEETVQEDGTHRRHHYPLRPDAEDCSFYMRTGACKFGSNCKFNHPRKRKNQMFKQTPRPKEENSERQGQTECKYYLSSGGCKYGKACKFSHSRGRPALPTLEFNFLGLPIRQGEKECPFYMRNGTCKYGSNCRFNHPDPIAVGGGNSPVGYGKGGSASLPSASQTTMSSWSSPRAMNEPPPFVPMMYSPTHAIPSPTPEWNGYQAPLYPTSERSLPTPPAFALNNSPHDTSLYTNHSQQALIGDYPERPGQPECSYFLKTGDCKYRSTCKFHHPKSRIPKTSQSVLSDKGLPLRPDQNVCSHYSRYGICKYGPACKYDHPVNYINPVFAGGSGPDGPRTAGGIGRESLIQQPV